MTEVAGLLASDQQLTAVKHYEAGPPEGFELVEPGETFATTKEEEWVSKKKTEVLNTKQIETRVKRQVVLEDGKVVDDSGPMVTTNTTEDTETQEHHQTELRRLGDDDVDGGPPRALGAASPDLGALAERPPPGWVAVANADGVVREVKERRVVSREETEEVQETEDVQHLGDITDEEFLAAVRSGKSDLRQVLRSSDAGRTLVSTGPRLVHESSKSQKVTDTEDTRELSSVLPDGKIVTETERTTEHEEVRDDELPEDAPEQDYQKESSQRYRKTREQEDVEYLSGGVNVGREMRFKTETMEAERRGGLDEPDLFDARPRHRVAAAAAAAAAARQQPHRYRGVENGGTPLERKDALTRRPLDFDQEEETRKAETSKWLEHHFGSESRSSNSTLDDEEPHSAPKTSFFNVTIKSQPSRTEANQKNHQSHVNNSSPRVYSPVEPERDRNHVGYYKGISEWNERRQEYSYSSDRLSPSPYHRTPSPYQAEPPRRSPAPDYRQEYSPVPDYRLHHSPTPDYAHSRHSPQSREGPSVTPTPPQRKKASERQRQRVLDDRQPARYDDGYRAARPKDLRDPGERVAAAVEPPPDYSPPSPPPPPAADRKPAQKTRFAAGVQSQPQPKPKSGNIIGQSIRKLVGKIRSASAERKARQRARRSPSPSYQPGHVIDSNIGHGMDGRPPVQRYYLGEDPFAGSIYGRENKYDGAKPARSSRRGPREDERRSQSTLGRFSKSTGRLPHGRADEERNTRTLPRHLDRRNETPTRLDGEDRSNSTINVSIINTVSSPRAFKEGPAKPARTYRSSLARSKSFNANGACADAAAEEPRGRRASPAAAAMHASNPHLHRLADAPSALKSPGLISSLGRGRDAGTDVPPPTRTARFDLRNGDGAADARRFETEYQKSFSAESNGRPDTTKRAFMSSLKERAPDLFRTLDDSDDGGADAWRPHGHSTPAKNGRSFNGDIYEPPTRLRDTHIIPTAPTHSTLRRGSTSSTDFSETYHTTTRNDDPMRPSVTNTTKTVSKKTLPGRDGRSLETIESSEMKSVTKSHYRSGSRTEPLGTTYYEERRYNSSSGTNPVVIEVRNNYRK